MSCLLVTPNEDLLFDEAMTQTRTLRFHKLSKLLKQRTRELMAKFSGFFRKSNKTWSYDTLTVKKLDSFMEELSAPKILLPSIATLMSTSVRKMDWSIETTKKAYEEVECEWEDDCDGELYEKDCECEDCCNYREENDIKDDYTESEYDIIIQSKPSEPKKWYEKGAIVLPF